MASVESNKKVARAAKAGGGVSRRQTSTSWGYYGTLIGIAVIGTGLIATSFLNTREDGGVPYLQSEARATEERSLLTAAQKKYKGKPESKELLAAQEKYDNYIENNHIHAAYAMWDCTKDKGKEWLAPVNGEGDPDDFGIHAHADGLIHAHPFSRAVTGRRARLEKFFDSTGMTVSSNKIEIPAKPAAADGSVPAVKAQTLKSGTKCKSGKESEIAVYEFTDVIKDGVLVKTVEGKRSLGEASSIPIRKNSAYVFALIEKDKVPELPPSAAALSAPSDQVSATADEATPANEVTTEVTPPSVVGSSVVGSSVVGSSVVGSSVASSSVVGSSVVPTTAETPAKTSVAPTTQNQ
jgi:hypothetical protein